MRAVANLIFLIAILLGIFLFINSNNSYKWLTESTSDTLKIALTIIFIICVIIIPVLNSKKK